MPAKNPRLTITLQPSLAAQLRRLSELTGNSQSGLIGEMLEGSGPVFDRMIQVMEAAQTAKNAMRGKLADQIDQAQTKIEGALGIALEDFENLTGSLLDEAEAVTRRAAPAPHSRTRRAGAGVGLAAPELVRPTPISNRGVRFTVNTPEKIAINPSIKRVSASKVGDKNRGVK